MLIKKSLQCCGSYPSLPTFIIIIMYYVLLLLLQCYILYIHMIIYYLLTTHHPFTHTYTLVHWIHYANETILLISYNLFILQV